jgi:apolipoprotein N-acyltransferase
MWIAYRLAPVPELVQAVSITGTPALSLLIHVVNATVALGVIALIDRLRPGLATVAVPRRVLGWSVAIPVAAVAVWTAASLLIFRDVSNRMGPEVRVAAVQPGLDNATPGTLISVGNVTPGRSDEQRNNDQIAQLSAMTRDAAAKGAKVVVWPEETLNYDPRVAHTDWIPALVRQTNPAPSSARSGSLTRRWTDTPRA